jgi:hypothetical protein
MKALAYLYARSSCVRLAALAWPRRTQPVGARLVEFIRIKGPLGIEPDPEKAPLVRELFEAAATGASDREILTPTV